MWERGSKVLSTPPAPVNPHTRAVFWQQTLRQAVTVYAEGGAFAPKEYVFTVQEVRRGRGGREERRTVGKVALDLARFCDAEVEPLPQEVFLQLRWAPAGRGRGACCALGACVCRRARACRQRPR